MIVNGTINCKVDITSEEALRALCEHFGININIFDDYVAKTEKGVTGIYLIRKSFHSNKMEYELVHKGKNAEQIFDALKLLKKTVELDKRNNPTLTLK